MRDWLTTRETQTLLGLSHQRISQLRKAGRLTATTDAEGRLRYDRIEVEDFQRERAERDSSRAEKKAERESKRDEARYRLRRQRRQQAQEQAERDEAERAWRERVVRAVEKIASALSSGNER